MRQRYSEFSRISLSGDPYGNSGRIDISARRNRYLWRSRTGCFQRTQEIGIRLTLGAEPTQIFGLVLRQGMGMVGIGVVIGIMGAFGLTRLISTMLYGVGPTDFFVFIAVTVSLISVALLACYVPARQAMRVPPMVALRYE